MNESDYIYRLVRWMRAAGVKIHLHALDLPCSGMYRSETREIFVNVASSKDGLLTLAHEAGHWLGYVCFGERPHSYQRERQAFVYGWRALCLVGADKIVTREEWIQAERERREAPDVDTSGVPSREEALDVVG